MSYHHPDQPVRHSYPLAIESAGVGASFRLLMKTLPYTLVRFGILVAVSIASILWFGISAGGGAWLGDKVHPWIGTGWFVGGMGVYGWFWWTILRYMLYLLKAGHIAVLTELITTGEIANGEKGMFQYGKDVVTERFKEVSLLFGLDLLISGVVKAFNRTLEGLANLLPIPGLQGLVQILNAIVHAMTTFIDETIFSYNLARGDSNPWRSGRDGLIYYAQNAMDILKTSLWIVVLEKVLVFISWLIFLAPAFGIAALMPNSNVAVAAFFFAALFAWNVKAAFLHPLFLIMILTRFHVSIKGQAIDEAWDGRLSQASGKFDTIKQNMREWGPDVDVSEPPISSPPAPEEPEALPPPPPPPPAPAG